MENHSHFRKKRNEIPLLETIVNHFMNYKCGLGYASVATCSERFVIKCCCVLINQPISNVNLNSYPSATISMLYLLLYYIPFTIKIQSFFTINCIKLYQI